MPPVHLPLTRPLLFSLALPLAAGAQSRGGVDRVPLDMLPPAGMCRIWMTGVPAAQQPAPTDCATALRQRPTNGVVLYGPSRKDDDEGRFDPRVGKGADARAARDGRKADSLERGGSPAERELAERRAREERMRRYTEMREREERTRREMAERAALNRGGAAARSAGGAPAGGGTASPRTATERGGGVTPAKSAPAESRGKPAEPPPKKPE